MRRFVALLALLAAVVTHGEAFAVQPFSNLLSTMSLDVAAIVATLEGWVSNGGPLQVAGITYTGTRASPPAAASARSSSAAS